MIVEQQPLCTVVDGVRHLSSSSKTDAGAPGVRRGKAAWDCIDCYTGRAYSFFQAVHSRLIINLHQEPIEARPFVVPCPRAIAVPDVDSHMVVIATRGYEGGSSAAARHIEAEHIAIKRFGPGDVPDAQMDVADPQSFRCTGIGRDRRINLADDRVDVERVGLLENQFTVVTPFLAWPVGIDFDTIAFRVV